MLGLLAAGALLIAGCNRDKKPVAVLQCTGGGILAVLGALSVAALPTGYLTWPRGVVAVIGLACCAGSWAMTA